MQLVVPVGVFAFLPLRGDIKGFTIALLLFGALFTAAAYGDDLRDRRLRQHGLAPPVGPDQ